MPQHICSVLKREHELYMETIRNCETIVKKLYKSVQEVTGKELAYLHTTHGCDPETLEYILGDTLPKQIYEDYKGFMEYERSLSRSAMKREVISVVQPA